MQRSIQEETRFNLYGDFSQANVNELLHFITPSCVHGQFANVFYHLTRSWVKVEENGRHCRCISVMQHVLKQSNEGRFKDTLLHLPRF